MLRYSREVGIRTSRCRELGGADACTCYRCFDSNDPSHGNLAKTRLNQKLRPPSGHAEHYQSHIIVLWSAPCERLCCSQDSPHSYLSWKSMTCFGEFNQSFFAPF